MPTEEGYRRYPPDGCYIATDDPEDIYSCTCSKECPRPCKGKCGCEACDVAYQDLLSLPEV
jgi:hypothetical protein